MTFRGPYTPLEETFKISIERNMLYYVKLTGVISFTNLGLIVAVQGKL